MTAPPYQNRPIKSAFVRKAYVSKGDDATLSRWVKVPHSERGGAGKPRSEWLFSPHLARPARSIFWRKGIKKPSELKTLFVSGHSNAKIGRDVRKGLFRGYWIYTLSFEERATCPTSCRHWLTCYGNNMPYAKRIDHTEPGLLGRLASELYGLCVPHGNVKRTGVLIRLHALGDFYSAQYVQFWGMMLRKFPNLACYGYTARPRRGDRIGHEIKALKREFDRRFAIRWSDGGGPRDCTISLAPGVKEPAAGSFLCPEQSPGFTAKGKPILCATCGLCWSVDRNVSFREH